MKSTTRWIAGSMMMALALAAPLSAATYTDAEVTSATLGEQDAVNVYTSGYTSTWGSSDTSLIKMGNDGGTGVSGVSFNITDANDMNTRYVYVGYGADADNCNAVVDGTNIAVSYWMSVGTATAQGAQGGDNCSLTIQNGSKLVSTTTLSSNYHYVGAGGTTGAALNVTGAGSQYLARRIVRMASGAGTITVENGALFASTGESGGVYTEDGDYVRLNGGFVALGEHVLDAGSVGYENRLQLWNGSAWVNLTDLDETQRDALGYSVTQCADAAAFEAATGLTDPGLNFSASYDFDGQAVTGVTVFTSNYAPVPEPASIALLATGALALIRRRRK